MNWIEVPPGKYSLLKGKDKKSQCQIELSVRFDIYLTVWFLIWRY
jgi:DNA polymerase delta subunit 1